MKEPTSIEDDHLSHEPDFSFRNTIPADLDFTGKHPVISAAQAEAKIQPVAPVTEPIPAPVAAITVTETPVAPAESVQVTIMREPRQATSGLSVAAFVLSLAGIITPFFLIPLIVSVLAIILGHVGARQAKRQQLAGRGLGIAAYVIGYLTILVTLIVIGVIIVLSVGAYNGMTGLLQQYGGR